MTEENNAIPNDNNESQKPANNAGANAATNAEPKETTIGLVAYLTLIGFIIALVLNNDKKGETKSFGAFHLRQSLGIMIVAVIGEIVLVILSVILSIISWVLGTIIGFIISLFWLAMLALLIIGIVNAANGKKKAVPVVGDFISKMLGKAFD